MKKPMLSFSIILCSTGSILAQLPTVPAPQTIPTPVPTVAYPGNTNQPNVAGLTFSNHAGQIYSPEDLAAQLQNLRTAVDQALPVLAAFNEHYSNSVVGAGRQTVGGTLSGIVSDVMRRNQIAQNYGANQNALGTNKLLSALHALLSTNTPGALGTSPTTAQYLIALQNELQPVVTVLERLDVGPSPNPAATPYNNGAQPYPGAIPSPTGR